MAENLDSSLVKRLTEMTENDSLKWTDGGSRTYLSEYSDLILQLFAENGQPVLQVDGLLEITDSDTNNNGSLSDLLNSVEAKINSSRPKPSAYDRQQDLEDILKRLNPKA